MVLRCRIRSDTHKRMSTGTAAKLSCPMDRDDLITLYDFSKNSSLTD